VHRTGPDPNRCGSRTAEYYRGPPRCRRRWELSAAAPSSTAARSFPPISACPARSEPRLFSMQHYLMPQLADAGAAPALAVFPKGVLARAPPTPHTPKNRRAGPRSARQGKTTRCHIRARASRACSRRMPFASARCCDGVFVYEQPAIEVDAYPPTCATVERAPKSAGGPVGVGRARRLLAHRLRQRARPQNAAPHAPIAG
jgi:hypothetical protein